MEKVTCTRISRREREKSEKEGRGDSEIERRRHSHTSRRDKPRHGDGLVAGGSGTHTKPLPPPHVCLNNDSTRRCDPHTHTETIPREGCVSRRCNAPRPTFALQRPTLTPVIVVSRCPSIESTLPRAFRADKPVEYPATRDVSEITRVITEHRM